MLDTGTRFRVLGGRGKSKAKAASKASGRSIDVQDWMGRMADLPRIMSVTQSIFLQLETPCHEALLRVALELALDTEARRSFAWTASWYHDDAKREWFRHKVKEKLHRVFRMLEAPLDESLETAAMKLKAEASCQTEGSRSSEREKLLERELQELREKLALEMERSQSLTQTLEARAAQLAEVQERFERQKQELDHLQEVERLYKEMRREVQTLREEQLQFQEERMQFQKLQQVHARCGDNQRELAELRQASKQAQADREELERLREEARASKQRAAALEAEKANLEETFSRQQQAMKEMQTKLQEMMHHSKESGSEAVVHRLMKKVGISEAAVISTDQVWVRLYKDAVLRKERQAKLQAEKQAQQQKQSETQEAEAQRRESVEIFGLRRQGEAAGDAASPTRKETLRTEGCYPAPAQNAAQGSPMCAWLRADLDLSPVRVMQAPRRRRILAPPKGSLQTSNSAPSFPAAVLP